MNHLLLRIKLLSHCNVVHINSHIDFDDKGEYIKSIADIKGA